MDMEDNKINLTKKAREIFGDVVENAYGVVSVFKLDDKELEDINKEYNDSIIKRAEDDVCESDINLENYDNVIIEFINGKKIKVSVSEWGTIKKNGYN